MKGCPDYDVSFTYENSSRYIVSLKENTETFNHILG